MPEQPYDKSSKWLLEHCGKALAFVGGLTDVVSTRSLQSEVVQSRWLPDGLLEVRRKGQRDAALLLVEFCTYPESRASQQLMDDVMLVYQAHKVLPEVLALVLYYNGPQQLGRVPPRSVVRLLGPLWLANGSISGPGTGDGGASRSCRSTPGTRISTGEKFPCTKSKNSLQYAGEFVE